MSDLTILALDLGSRVGFAVSTGTSGAVDFRPKRTVDPISRHQGLFDRFSLWLSDMLHEHRPAVLVLEKNPRLGRLGQAAPVLLGLRACALVVAYRHELLVDELPSAGQAAPDKSDETDARRILERWLATRAQHVRAA